MSLQPFSAERHSGQSLRTCAFSDPTTQQTAIKNVNNSVKAGVTSAIKGVLSTEQEIEIILHILTLDFLVDLGFSVFSNIAPQSFAQSIVDQVATQSTPM